MDGWISNYFIRDINKITHFNELNPILLGNKTAVWKRSAGNYSREYTQHEVYKK